MSAIDPELVLFDLDDTLCDYSGARVSRLRRAFEEAAATAGVNEPVDFDALITESIAIQPHGSDYFHELLPRYGIFGSPAVEAARAWLMANRYHGLALFDDTLATLSAIRARRPERRIGVITNGPTELQRTKVELLALEGHVDFVIISEEFGAWKPEAAIFEEGLRLGAAAPDRAVFIGDSADHDILGARGAGIEAIWISRFGQPWSLPAPPPRRIARNLTEVRRLLKDDQETDG